MKKFIGILLDLLCGPIQILLLILVNMIPIANNTNPLVEGGILVGTVVLFFLYSFIHWVIVFNITGNERRYLAVLSTFITYVLVLHFWEEIHFSIIASVIVALILEAFQYKTLLGILADPTKEKRFTSTTFHWSNHNSTTTIRDEDGNETKIDHWNW